MFCHASRIVWNWLNAMHSPGHHSSTYPIAHVHSIHPNSALRTLACEAVPLQSPHIHVCSDLLSSPLYRLGLRVRSPLAHSLRDLCSNWTGHRLDGLYGGWRREEDRRCVSYGLLRRWHALGDLENDSFILIPPMLSSFSRQSLNCNNVQAVL